MVKTPMKIPFTKEELKRRREARSFIVKKHNRYYIKMNTFTGLSDLCSDDPEWAYFMLGVPNRFSFKR